MIHLNVLIRSVFIQFTVPHCLIVGHFKSGVLVGVGVSDFKSGVGLITNAKQHQHWHQHITWNDTTASNINQ